MGKPGAKQDKRGRASWPHMGARRSWHCMNSTNPVSVYCIVNVTVRL